MCRCSQNSRSLNGEQSAQVSIINRNRVITSYTMLGALSTFLTIVGLYSLSCYLYENLRTPYKLFKLRVLSGGENRPSLKERFGSWAAVTGSSDGIGKEYAKELARQGINVMLIARNEAKLKAVADEIVAESKVQTKIVVADFTEGAAVYEHIERELSALPIAILVNNVGIGFPGPLDRYSREQVQHLIDTNIVAVSELSRYFFNHLRQSGIKGAIVNVSSGTELQPLPYGALYGASKAFNRSFTIALQHEAAPYGILVQLLSPNFVVTKINTYSKLIMQGGLFIPSAEAYARSAVAQLRDGVDETPGFIWHHVQNTLWTIFNWRLRLYCAKMFFKSTNKKK